MVRKRISIAVTVIWTWAALAMPGFAALILNAPLPITQRVTVQPIIVSDSDGTNTAEFLGTPSQQTIIEGLIDDIWAQAGIDVQWLSPNYWNNTTANSGVYSLSSLGSNGNSAGVVHSDPLVLNAYFVEITPGSTDLGEYTANGLAWVGSNGISQANGDQLVTWLAGQEVVASVVAHEIGHNLGLDHIASTENLMLSSGDGERLTSSQISTASASSFSVAYTPEPADFNGDGFVNEADFLDWKSGFGTSAGALHQDGDADRDNDIDGIDFLTWQQSFESPPPTFLATVPDPSIASVPEPSTWLLSGLTFLLACAIGRSRNRGLVF